MFLLAETLWDKEIEIEEPSKTQLVIILHTYL